MAKESLHIPWNDKETRLDYGSRTDGQPEFQGFAPTGTGTAENRWTIYKFTYDGNDFLTRREVFFKKIWDDRSGL